MNGLVTSAAAHMSEAKCLDWDAFRSRFKNVQCKTEDRRRFTGRMDTFEFQDMHLWHLVVDEHRFTADSKQPRGTGHVKALLQLAGSCHHVTEKRKRLVLEGEWIVYDVLEGEPHTIENHGRVNQMVFLLPRKNMRLAEFGRLRTNGIHFGKNDPVSSLMFNTFAGKETEKTHNPRKASDLLRFALRAVPMALFDAAGQTREDNATGGALSSRVKHYVETHLLDSFLTIRDIAEAFQCSKRTLHTAFEREGESVSTYLWGRRLERVRDDLANSTMWSESITSIAFSWGFTSSAHFSRSFSRAYGQSPSSFRRSLQSHAWLDRPSRHI